MTGTTARPNDYGVISISPDNLIGGDTPQSRNIVSGNTYGGILVGQDGDRTRIQGNYIGVGATGAEPIGNGWVGIHLDASDGSIVGGSTPGLGNVIADNGTGIAIYDSSGNTIQGNLIGVDGLDSPAGNHGGGVVVFGGADNVIGGKKPGTGNIIAYNDGAGVFMRELSGPVIGNDVLGNSIHSNVWGIDFWAAVSEDFPTWNDVGDVDSGPNGIQNYPVITSTRAKNGSVTVRGFLDSTPVTGFRLEFFTSLACSWTGYGEGERFLGSKDVVTNHSGRANFQVSFKTGEASHIAATATGPDGTSEFSACFGV